MKMKQADRASVLVHGYAKINLHLDITGRLDGGYHSVETVMQTVSLSDDVILTRTQGMNKGGFSLLCDVAGVPTDERNLAVRAAKLFCERTGVREGVEIEIRKRIPMAAGLAGGSADAAATLLGMNQLYGEPLTIEELCALGSALGADVPFCIVGGTAYADGRGDVLHDFPKMPDCFLVVACAGEGVSTPWAYGRLDRLHADFGEQSDYRPRGVEVLRDALAHADLSRMASAMYNIFESPVLAERPVAVQIRQTLLDAGALGAMMSGSGPSVFGVFDDREVAEAAAGKLAELNLPSYVCHPIETAEGVC